MSQSSALAQHQSGVHVESQRQWKMFRRILEVAARTCGAALVLVVRLVAKPADRRNWREACGAAGASLCERLGPTFIKVGQVLSSRPDLLPLPFVQGLARLQDRVETVPEGDLRDALVQAFGAQPERVFASFDLTPIAAASISQVHRAVTADGRTIALKVKRPGIDGRMALDVAVVRWIARTFERIPGTSLLPLRDLVEEVVEPVLQQLDFYREAANNRRFRVNLRHQERILIPALIDEYCTATTIAMELLEDYEKPPAPNLTESERREGALAGLRALYRMIFTDGFVHADLHPGNVGFRKNGVLLIFDMGLVAELGPQDRKEFADFFFGLVNNEGAVCASILNAQASSVTAWFDRAAFDLDISRLIAKHSSLKSAEFQIAVFVAEMLGVQRRHGMRGSPKFIMTVLSMAVFDGICKQMYPACEFQKEARPYLILGRYGTPSRPAVRI